MANANSWFTVDTHGLAKLVDGKNKVFILYELVSNAWDTDASQVNINVTQAGHGLVQVVVHDDNPKGFTNLDHAYTLFAESEKKDASEKRGRFNLGEKLVLALCKEAKISTTTGVVTFGAKGRTCHKPNPEHKSGSTFTGLFKMTKAQMNEMVEDFKLVLPPITCTTTINGVELGNTNPLVSFSAKLPTVIGDNEGVLRKTIRKTSVELFPLKDGETEGYLYEMGIPVVTSGMPVHCNIHQKVPLSMERDAVHPSYLRDARAHVLNHYAALLTEEETTKDWVAQALESPLVDTAAVKLTVLTRFGSKTVVFDPSDQEANHKAASHDFTVVRGNTFSKEAWENVRKAEALPAAGKVFPTFGKGAPSIFPFEMTADMQKVCTLAKRLAHKLLGVDLTVNFHSNDGGYNALYSKTSQTRGVMTFNVHPLGASWFNLSNNLVNILDLIIHELGHHTEASHLSIRYADAVTSLGAKAVNLALTDPQTFTVA